MLQKLGMNSDGLQVFQKYTDDNTNMKVLSIEMLGVLRTGHENILKDAAGNCVILKN